MSLLMEALRKAEEAKSKAKQDEKESSASQDDQSTDADASTLSAPPASDDQTPLKSTVEPPILELEPESRDEQQKKSTGPQKGPVVINPDPDEEETLASHLAGAAQDTAEPRTDSFAENKEASEVDTLDDLLDDLEKIEFTSKTANEENKASDKEPPAPKESTEKQEENDGLSLLESSYFSRMKKSSRSSFDDFELEDLEGDVAPPVDKATQSEGKSESETEGASFETRNTVHVDEPLLHDGGEASEHLESADISQAQAESAAKKPKKADSAVRSTQEKLREKEKRDSANALFLAKQSSQKRRSSKFRAIAAVILIVPVAGISYWLYSSFNNSSGMQFNVPTQAELANRAAFPAEEPATADTTRVLSESDLTQLSSANDVSSESLSQDPSPALTQAPSEPASQTQPEQVVANSNDDAAAEAAIEMPQANQNRELALTQNVPPPQATVSNAQSGSTTPAAQSPANNISESTTQPPVQTITNQNRPTQPAPAGLSFVKAEVDNVLDPNLNAAFASYQQGDFESAGRLYQLVLNNEPNNRDAILGLASVYLRQNNIAFSQNLYARLLELNPRDPLALAGLLDITMRDDPVRQESELLSLTSAYPRIAPLSFALGNLYASQNRWSEAQNAYFNALLAAKSANSGAVSPDYAYNLAVSLERVNQLRAALDYYREAQELSRFTAPRFNPDVLVQRLNYLEQRVP